MSNYSRYRSKRTFNIDIELFILILCIVLAFLLVFASNACTAKEWNDGVCPDCNTRYELRGVYKGTRYYACPDCGNEVDRFGGR